MRVTQVSDAVAHRLDEFKRCTVCEKTWIDLRDFMTDPELRVEGYQACFLDPAAGLVLVTHCREDCGTTLSIRVEALKVLYDGPEHLERYTGTEQCNTFCLLRNMLEECDVHCEMAWARKALQWLRRREIPAHMSEDGR